jgi:hypothetical protein
MSHYKTKSTFIEKHKEKYPPIMFKFFIWKNYVYFNHFLLQLDFVFVFTLNIQYIS